MFYVDSKARKVLGIYVTLNAPFGMWPLEKDNFFLRIRWVSCISGMAIMMLLVLYETYLNCEIAEYGVDYLLAITFGVMGFVKLLCCYLHREKLRGNIESAIEDWSSNDSINFNKIMYRRKNRCNKFVQYFLIFGTLTAITYPIKVLSTNSAMIIGVKNTTTEYKNMTVIFRKKFLFPAVCTLNDVSESSYSVIMIAQVCQYIVCVGVNLCCDAFLMVLANHLCGQFEILKFKFFTFKELNNFIDTRRQFSSLVIKHECLLNLANHLELSFNMIIFTQMIMNLILINVAGFNFLIFVQRGNIIGAMSNISIIVFTLVQTFLYSYMGEDISNQGDDIVRSVYENQWYTMPTSLSKDMLIVMKRSESSVHLTAGKFFKMTRSTFIDIVKTAFSYLSVLHVIIREKNV